MQIIPKIMLCVTLTALLSPPFAQADWTLHVEIGAQVRSTEVLMVVANCGVREAPGTGAERNRGSGVRSAGDE